MLLLYFFRFHLLCKTSGNNLDISSLFHLLPRPVAITNHEYYNSLQRIKTSNGSRLVNKNFRYIFQYKFTSYRTLKPAFGARHESIFRAAKYLLRFAIKIDIGFTRNFFQMSQYWHFHILSTFFPQFFQIFRRFGSNPSSTRRFKTRSTSANGDILCRAYSCRIF